VKVNTSLTVRPSKIEIDLSEANPKVMIKGSVRHGKAVLSEIRAVLTDEGLTKKLVELVTEPFVAKNTWLEALK
jgi:hypothetical protein